MGSSTRRGSRDPERPRSDVQLTQHAREHSTALLLSYRREIEHSNAEAAPHLRFPKTWNRPSAQISGRTCVVRHETEARATPAGKADGVEAQCFALRAALADVLHQHCNGVVDAEMPVTRNPVLARAEDK